MSTVKSTLSLNSTGAVPSILNYSRSSSATRVNAIGLVETVAANVIRQDYMPDDIGRLMGWLPARLRGWVGNQFASHLVCQPGSQMDQWVSRSAGWLVG